MKRVIISICLLFGLVGATSVNALTCTSGAKLSEDGMHCEKDWVNERLQKRLAHHRYEIHKIEAVIGLLKDHICMRCDLAGEYLSGVDLHWQIFVVQTCVM